MERLWQDLEILFPSCVLDPSFKAYIWRQLLTHCTSDHTSDSSGLSLSLYKTPAGSSRPRDHAPVLESTGDWYVHPHAYSFVSDKARGVRGSCSTYDSREDVTDAVRRENLQLEEVQER